MIYRKLVLSFTTFALLASNISPAFSRELGLNFPTPLGAEPTLLAQAFPSPPGGPPPNSSGGGTRSIGSQLLGLIPLAPQDQGTQTLWGRTISATPTFFLYVPAGFSNPIKFFLVNEQDGESLYEQVVPFPASGGVVSVPLPNKAGKTLQEGKVYNWYFEVQQGENDQIGVKPFIGGLVQRIPVSQELSNRLRTAKTDSDRAQIYAANGLWYDLIATAANLRGANPNNWEAMLNSVGLGAIAQVPLVTPVNSEINSNSSPSNRS